jgi:hypothetical protein
MRGILPPTEICNKGRTREGLAGEDVDDNMEEWRDAEDGDGCGYEGNGSRGRVDKPDKVDACLTAKLGAVKQIQ